MDSFVKLKACLGIILLCIFDHAGSAQSARPAMRFEEVGAKADVRVQHHTRSFPGRTGDVLRMFTSGGAAVAVGDYDNDGLDDMFVTDSDTGRKSHLYHNDGNFKFTE